MNQPKYKSTVRVGAFHATPLDASYDETLDGGSPAHPPRRFNATARFRFTSEDAASFRLALTPGCEVVVEHQSDSGESDTDAIKTEDIPALDPFNGSPGICVLRVERIFWTKDRKTIETMPAAEATP